MTINGVVNLNKRKGVSSFRAVREVKRALNADKAGHTGTLDPEASGVLPVCLGKSTRIADYLMKTEKEYKVRMFLGLETDTCDLEGSITGTSDVSDFSFEKLLELLNTFKGEITQVPPVYSAIKVNGRKLYDYARKGEAVEIKPRQVEIFNIENISYCNNEYEGRKVIEVSFTVGCSKGTYIRSLCRDIGEKAGFYGVMADLIRLRTGKFNINEAYTIDEIKSAYDSDNLNRILLKAEDLLEIPLLILNEEATESYLLGRKVVLTGVEPGEYLVKSYKKDTIGIGTADEGGSLKSRKRL